MLNCDGILKERMITFTSCSLAITSGSFSKFLGKAERRIPAFLFQQREEWAERIKYSKCRA